MVPDWMETLDENGNAVIKNNGVWTNTSINIPELIATYLKVWFEDSVPTELLNVMKESAGKYTPAAQAAAIENVFAQLVAERIAELSKLIENEETATA
jgi:hypothetical protein